MIVDVVFNWSDGFHLDSHFIINSNFNLVSKVHIIFKNLCKSKFSLKVLFITLEPRNLEILKNMVSWIHT